MSDVDLHRLAVIYLTAVHEHRPPTVAVQLECDLTRAKAGQLIRAARGQGLLPAAAKGQATPRIGHWPRVAKVLNGESYFVVCLTCHHLWPCRSPDTLAWLQRLQEQP